MGLEEVKDDILKEAKQEKEQIIEEAENKRKEIIEEAESEAERIRSKKEREIEEEKEAIEKKEVSKANMEAKKLRLEAKQTALDSVFSDFRETIEDLSDEDKEEMLENAITSAEFEVGTVRGSEEFEDVVDRDFEESEVEGFILVSEDGERQLNFSLDKVVNDLQKKHRQEVSEILFG